MMMKRIVFFIFFFVTIAFLVVPDTCFAKSETADKTQVNEPEQEFTADQIGDTKNDREMTQKELTAQQVVIKNDREMTQNIRPADNTGINKRDQSQKELTADQQGETKNDREITRKIRRAVIADKSLSTNAHNVKIITVGGMVTLKGPVRSEEEKNSVEEKAAGIVGKTNIKNEIGIAPKKKISKK